MKDTVFNTEATEKLIQRLENIKPDAQRQWGKMNAAQMLAHCQLALETARGNHKMKRVLIGILFGKEQRKAC